MQLPALRAAIDAGRYASSRILTDMNPCIGIKRIWSDQDVLELEVRVCDGRSVFVMRAYAGFDWGTQAAAGLRTFARQIHGGRFDLECGNRGREHGGEAFQGRFHYYRPTALLISTELQGDFFSFKGSEVAADATMFLRTEPALLDRFIAALPELDQTHGSGPRSRTWAR